MLTTAHLIDMSALKRGDLVGVDALVESDAALARSARRVVLDPPARVHLDLAGVHAHRHGDFEDPLGSDDSLDQSVVESEESCRPFRLRRSLAATG